MKCTIPEISWHNRDPVLSLDIQQIPGEGHYRLASGGADTHVLIWHMKILPNGGVNAENVSDLQRHDRSVNIVRWSPSGQFLASGDDDANIIIWQQKMDAAPLLDEANNDKEIWVVYKVLRGHKQDVYDICWSPNSEKLITGSIDNTSILWDLSKGKMEHILSDHKGFVQGVTWDPKSKFVATLSADRVLRIFDINGKIKCRISKGILPVPKTHNMCEQDVKYFHDDTLKTYFRRLGFSPDGNLIIAPAGCIETDNATKSLYASYIFTMDSIIPVAILPSPDHFTLAIKCCPILFELQPNGPTPAINLPYRIVIAVATRKAVILYDTQQLSPFAVISNMHYACLTDIAWSHDGRLLAVSSIDGYCSLVSFEPSELGREYVKEESEAEENMMDISGCEQLEQDCTTSINIEEVVASKPKRPNILEQWTIKTPKRMKTEHGIKDANEILDSDEGIKSKKFSPSKTHSDAKPIEVRRKPREINNDEQSVNTSSGKSGGKVIAKTLEVKPIAVRRKLKQTCENKPAIENVPAQHPIDEKIASKSPIQKSNAKFAEICAKPKNAAKLSNIKRKPEAKNSGTANLGEPKQIVVCKKNKNAPSQNNPLLNFLKKADKVQSISTAENIKSTITSSEIIDLDESQEPWICHNKETHKETEKEDITSDHMDCSIDLTLHLDESLPTPEKHTDDNGSSEGQNVISDITINPKVAINTNEISNKLLNNKENEIDVLKLDSPNTEDAENETAKEPQTTEMQLSLNSEDKAEIVKKLKDNKTDAEVIAEDTCVEKSKLLIKTDNHKEKPPLEDKNIQTLKTSEGILISPGKEKRRIPLITLSSPKNKKKTSD